MTVQPLPQGFAHPVADAQAVFRNVMMALARPGDIRRLVVGIASPPPLSPEMAGVALALCDHETPIWIDEGLSANPAVAAFLKFHTGAEIVADARAAAFAFAADAAALPPLSAFAAGSDEYPDRSTTVVLAVSSIRPEAALLLEGPGIRDRAFLEIEPMPADFAAQLARNASLFPRGVDCIFVSAGRIAALPRSTRVREV